MSTSGINKLTAAVEADSDVDFVADAHVLLALAISRLQPEKRANALEGIEDTLRQEVVLCLASRQSPYPRAVGPGNGGLL
jgi:hypothetical protein